MRHVHHVPDSIVIAPSPEAAVQDADIICAATTSSTPVFPGELVKPGTHINAIGSFTPDMQEIDSVLLQKAIIVVDSREAVLAESGDLIIPIQQGILNENRIHAELGEIVRGDRPGRETRDQITVFKSVGLAVQDAIAASAALNGARQAGLGVQVDL
jgi:ornithine cyclodeaminase